MGTGSDDEAGKKESGAETSDEGSDDDKPRRRQRNRKDRIKGFTDSEIRSFIRSYKKFGRPKQRLDIV